MFEIDMEERDYNSLIPTTKDGILENASRIRIEDDGGLEVLRANIGGTNVGDVIFGSTDTAYMLWDKSLRESIIFTCDITQRGIDNINLIPLYINDNYQIDL